jgi:hypothetical protein
MSTQTMAYARKLNNWDTKAAVRVKPRRILLQDEESMGRVYFSPELVPVAWHPLARGLGPAAVRDMQVQHLYRHIDFTTQLELEVINEVSKEIALGKLDADVPDVMREDAFKLCTDEAHHAYLSDDLKRQVEAASGIHPDRVGTPPFLRRLRTLQREMPSELRPLGELLFAVVSETLISGILAGILRDRRVVTAVRAIVADHAEDEGRHSAYFSQLFAFLWPRLDDRQKAALGPLLPRFILAFLEPDYPAIRDSLSKYPLGADQVHAVVDETYPRSVVLADAREVAKVTLHLFRHNGEARRTVPRPIDDRFGPDDRAEIVSRVSRNPLMTPGIPPASPWHGGCPAISRQDRRRLPAPECVIHLRWPVRRRGELCMA